MDPSRYLQIVIVTTHPRSDCKQITIAIDFQLLYYKLVPIIKPKHNYIPKVIPYIIQPSQVYLTVGVLGLKFIIGTSWIHYSVVSHFQSN